MRDQGLELEVLAALVGVALGGGRRELAAELEQRHGRLLGLKAADEALVLASGSR